MITTGVIIGGIFLLLIFLVGISDPMVLSLLSGLFPKRKKIKKEKNMAQEKKARMPTAEDFSHGAVRKAVFEKACKHPLTGYSAVTFFLSLVYMGLISSNPITLAISFFSFVATLGGFGYNYFFKGEQYAAQYVNGLRKAREEYKKQDVDDLRYECSRFGFFEGQRIVEEFNEMFSKLNQLLKEQSKNGSMSAGTFSTLAENAYEEGISTVRKALTLYKALKNINYDSLEQDLRYQKKEFERLQKAKVTPAIGVQIGTIKIKIENAEKSVALYNERTTILQELVSQAQILKGALEQAYLQEAGSASSDPLQSLDSSSNAVSQLEIAVKAARKVEERLRGQNNNPDDQKYLELGRQERK